MRRLGLNDDAIQALQWSRSAVALSLRSDVRRRPILSSDGALLDYLRFTLGSSTTERLRALYLNARYELLADEQTGAGTVDAASFYPREIIGRALELGASFVILAHNHPSGDARPSAEDVACTTTLARLCAGLNLTLLDHVIIARERAISLRATGLLPKL